MKMAPNVETHTHSPSKVAQIWRAYFFCGIKLPTPWQKWYLGFGGQEQDRLRDYCWEHLGISNSEASDVKTNIFQELSAILVSTAKPPFFRCYIFSFRECHEFVLPFDFLVARDAWSAKDWERLPCWEYNSVSSPAFWRVLSGLESACSCKKNKVPNSWANLVLCAWMIERTVQCLVSALYIYIYIYIYTRIQ